MIEYLHCGNHCGSHHRNKNKTKAHDFGELKSEWKWGNGDPVKHRLFLQDAGSQRKGVIQLTMNASQAHLNLIMEMPEI